MRERKSVSNAFKGARAMVAASGASLACEVLTSSASPLDLVALEVSFILKDLYEGHLAFPAAKNSS